MIHRCKHITEDIENQTLLYVTQDNRRKTHTSWGCPNKQHNSSARSTRLKTTSVPEQHQRGSHQTPNSTTQICCSQHTGNNTRKKKITSFFKKNHLSHKSCKIAQNVYDILPFRFSSYLPVCL